MERCLPFKGQAPGTLHKFLLFWLNIRRGKTFWCASEGSTHTSNVSINGKAASPRNNKKYKHGSWLQECHSVESHWLREAPQSRAGGEPQPCRLPLQMVLLAADEAPVSWGILGTRRTQAVMLCWFQHPRSKVRGIRTLYLGLPAWLTVYLESLRDFLVEYYGSQHELRIRTEKAESFFGREVADFIPVLLGTHL